jgi:hypothetical protein
MPPSLCADVVFYLEDRRTPRDAYKILSRYLNVSVPKVVIDTEIVEEHSRGKHGRPDETNGFYRRSELTVYLRHDFETRTAIHEFFHHFAKERDYTFDHDRVYEYADEVIRRASLILK